MSKILLYFDITYDTMLVLQSEYISTQSGALTPCLHVQYSIFTVYNHIILHTPTKYELNQLSIYNEKIGGFFVFLCSPNNACQ